MAKLEAAYGAGRTSIVMKADLVSGLGEKDGKLKFVGQCRLPYKGDTSFRCQLHVSFDTADRVRLASALQACDNTWSAPGCTFVIRNQVLTVECSIKAQYFRPSSLKSRNPVSFYTETANRLTSNKEALDRLKNRDKVAWSPNTSIQYWIAIHGPNSMFVADQFVDFEDKSVIAGGRPESNRRRF